MKKLLLALLLPCAAHGAAWDLSIQQYDQFGTSTHNRLVTLPAGGVSGIVVYDSNTNLPKLATVDSSLTISTANPPVISAVGTGGTVTSVGVSSTNLTVTGSPVTTFGTIAVSLPNTGSAGTYSSVTTDAQGRVTAGTTRSITSPSRAVVTSTSSTGFQVSATRDAQVCYEGTLQTTSTIGGPATANVFLETADTNSTTPGDWTTIAQQNASNTITLAVVLQNVDGEPWSMCRIIPAGKFVRIRTSGTGTFSASINAQQQEVIL